jgi:hypothetical protein
LPTPSPDTSALASRVGDVVQADGGVLRAVVDGVDADADDARVARHRVEEIVPLGHDEVAHWRGVARAVDGEGVERVFLRDGLVDGRERASLQQHRAVQVPACSERLIVHQDRGVEIGVPMPSCA